MVLENVSLKSYNTFGLDHTSEFFITLNSERESSDVFKDGRSVIKPLLILGGGSNMLFTADFKGTIIHPQIGGIYIEDKKPDYAIVSSGAGINWDSFVEWTVNQGFGGIENLSLIPGTVGASPVQNIGAYGAEVKDSIEKVRAVSLKDGSIREFSNNDCKFGYRNSIFKNEIKGRYLITRVYFKLNSNSLLNLNYGPLKDEVDKLGSVTLKNVRQAVINIRRSKLPDPEIIGNAGSFFKNPVVTSVAAVSLKNSYPDIPVYEDQSGGIKLPAGWLIEQCGWKGKRIGDAGVHEKQALVIVNHGGATGKEIYGLSEAVKKSVWEKFGVELEREIEVIGTI